MRSSRRGFEAIWRIGASEAVMARGYSSPFGGSNARDFGASSPQPRTRTVAFPRRNQAPRASPESRPRKTAPAMPPNPPLSMPKFQMKSESCCNDGNVARQCFCGERAKQTTGMISNERPSPSGYRSYGGGNPKQPLSEEILKSEQLQIERKMFTLALKENPRGRFLRITEDVGGRYDNIMIPSSGLEEFQRVFDEMAKLASEIPERKPPNLA